jgi:MFS family permease
LPSAAPNSAAERLLNRDFVLVTLANFVNSFGSQMLTATLPVYVLVLGGNQTEAGIVSATMAFTALLLRPAIGWLADAWLRRPLVLIGTAGYGLGGIVYLLANSVPWLVVGRVVHGFGLSNYTTASGAYLADIAPLRRRAEAVGLFSAAQALGLIIGPAIGFFIVGWLGFRSMFYCATGLAFLASVISIFTRERRRRPVGPRPAWSLRTGIVALEALPMAWTTMCLGMGFGPLSAFIAIYASTRGVENPGLFFTVQALALLVARPLGGQLADRRGREVVLIPGLIVTALALLALTWADDFASIMAVGALFGLGFGAAQPATMALLIDRVGSQRRGMAMSTYYTGFDLGISVSSVALGAVSQVWGFGAMWSISAACVLLGLLGLLSARRRPVTLLEETATTLVGPLDS